MHILVINGPNLNLLGTREPEMYGSDTLADLEKQWVQRAEGFGASIEAYQSNHEGAIIDAIGDAAGRCDGLVINAGALTHYSYAIRDAIAASAFPSVEVHISNIHEREIWRRTSVITEVCDLTIVGRGTVGYLNAIDHLTALFSHPPLVVNYGASDDTTLDLRTPDGSGPHPVALLIHGGFWRDIWKRDLMDPMAIDLTARGWATVNVEYSRGEGSYSRAPNDMRTAVEWVTDNADSHDLDADRVVAIGHSAGGYLALRLAHDRTGVAASIALGAISDLDSTSLVRQGDDPVALFLGSTRTQAPRLWDQAKFSGEPLVPVHLVHGADDLDVDPSQSEVYSRLRPVNTTLTAVDNCGHMDVIDPRSKCWPHVVAAIDGFNL